MSEVKNIVDHETADDDEFHELFDYLPPSTVEILKKTRKKVPNKECEESWKDFVVQRKLIKKK